MRFPETAKSTTSLAFSLGIIVAIVSAGWYYIVLPFQKHPQRPVFSNDFKAAPVPTSPIATIKIPAMPQPTVKAKPKSTDAKYQGKVNASIGLVFRADPSQASKSIGGADFNTKVSVLREAPDREWVYVRNENTKEEGWVRTGNITKE
jgi:hypothetical protein